MVIISISFWQWVYWQTGKCQAYCPLCILQRIFEKLLPLQLMIEVLSFKGRTSSHICRSGFSCRSPTRKCLGQSHQHCSLMHSMMKWRFHAIWPPYLVDIWPKNSDDLQLQIKKKEKKLLYSTNGTRRSMCPIENTLRIYLICIIWPDFWCMSTFFSVSVLPTKGAYV